MDVEHSPMPTLDEFSSEQPHETAEADEVDAAVVQSGLQFGLERRAILAKRFAFDDEGLDAGGSGFASPAASLLLEITTTISAGKFSAFAALTSAVMFDPRPEIRIATRFMISSALHREIEMVIVNDAVFVTGDDHLTEQRNAFAGLRQHIHDLLNRITPHDGDHADAAIEGPQQFGFGDAALLRQPFEHREGPSIR